MTINYCISHCVMRQTVAVAENQAAVLTRHRVRDLEIKAKRISEKVFKVVTNGKAEIEKNQDYNKSLYDEKSCRNI